MFSKTLCLLVLPFALALLAGAVLPFQAAGNAAVGRAPGHRFNIEEYNTYSCPWHHNLTAAIPSFRVAKALASNPGSRQSIRDFTWRNSEAFLWNSQQLMELGLMEPGQWF